MSNILYLHLLLIILKNKRKIYKNKLLNEFKENI